MKNVNLETLPMVDMDFMNEDHKEAVSLYQDVLATIESNGDVIGTFKLFIAHNVEHFEREEEQMNTYNFPMVMPHTEMHQQALAIFDEIIATLELGNNEDAYNTIREDVSDWFYNHIETLDTVTANFLHQAEQGITPTNFCGH